MTESNCGHISWQCGGLNEFSSVSTVSDIVQVESGEPGVIETLGEKITRK